MVTPNLGTHQALLITLKIRVGDEILNKQTLGQRATLKRPEKRAPWQLSHDAYVADTSTIFAVCCQHEGKSGTADVAQDTPSSNFLSTAA
jgi:hypothetical protein